MTHAILAVFVFGAWAMWFRSYRNLPFDSDHGVYAYPASRGTAPYANGHFDTKPPGIHWLWLALVRLGVPLTPTAWRLIYALHIGTASVLAAVNGWYPGAALVVGFLAFTPCLGSVFANTEGFALPFAVGAIVASQSSYPFASGVLAGIAAVFNPQIGIAAIVGSGVAEGPSWRLVLGVGSIGVATFVSLAFQGVLFKFVSEFWTHWTKSKRRALGGSGAHGRAYSIGAAVVALVAIGCSDFQPEHLPWVIAAGISLALPCLTGLVQPYHFIPAIVLASPAADLERLPFLIAFGLVASVCLPELHPKAWLDPQSSCFPGMGEHLRHIEAITEAVKAHSAETVRKEQGPSAKPDFGQVAILTDLQATQLTLPFGRTPFFVKWAEMPDNLKRKYANQAQPPGACPLYWIGLVQSTSGVNPNHINFVPGTPYGYCRIR